MPTLQDMPTLQEPPATGPQGETPSAAPRRLALGLAVVLVCFLSAVAWLQYARRPASTQQAYTASGYGGFVPVAPPHTHSTPPAAAHPAPPEVPAPSLPAATQAYQQGRYAEAARDAQRLLARHVRRQDLALRRQEGQARRILAYAFARQALAAPPPQRRQQMSEARAQFAALRVQAAALPGKGKPQTPSWEPTATLEEEAAFQHAVCTGALGDKTAAEVEYVAFIRAFPESPLVQAAVKRIARLHGGDIPKGAEAVWRQAMQTARERTQAREREQSLCGPECLAELLRRQGKAANVHALAREMGTSDRGTTMAALAQAAQHHGLPLSGLALTPAGLARQPLPLVALLSPAHYVLVERVTPDGITFWDPDGHGTGQAAAKRLTMADWGQRWQGVALAVKTRE